MMMTMMRMTTMRLKCSSFVGALSTFALLLLSLVDFTCADGIPTFEPRDDYQVFSDPKGVHYRELVVYNDYLYVGAQNYVFRRDLRAINDSTYAKRTYLPPTDEDIQHCKTRGKNEVYDCQNHITILLPRPATNDLFVCGTSAYSPRKFALDFDLNVTDMDGKESGLGYCPFDPDDNHTAIWIEEGNPFDIPSVYTATVTNLARSDPLIHRPSLNEEVKTVRTHRFNRKLLQDPDFVSFVDMGPYLYLFYRDNLYDFGRQDGESYKVQSFVYRICKSDLGVSSQINPFNYQWAVLLRVRLLCETKDSAPFSFNEIQGVEYLPNEGIFVAIFTASVRSFKSSAICSFSVSDLENAFLGPFRDLDINDKIVPLAKEKEEAPLTGHDLRKCINDTDARLPDRILSFYEKYPEMYLPVSGTVLTTLDHTFFTRLATARVTLSNMMNDFIVMFVSSDEGNVYKVLLDSVTRSATILASWDVSNSKITDMKVHESYLYVTSLQQVMQFHQSQCSQYILCTECVLDPYCGYNIELHQCERRAPGLLSIENSQREYACKSRLNEITAKPKYVSLTFDSGPALLSCTVAPYAMPHVRWTENRDNPITPDGVNYILTRDSDLVITSRNRTASGNYACYYKDFLVKKFSVVINENSNTAVIPKCTCVTDVAYIEKYKQWCRQFDEYHRAFKDWERNRFKNCHENSIP